MAKKKSPPSVWRKIIKRNERQGRKYFDVLVCNHAVEVMPSTRANTYRRFRSCPDCRDQVALIVPEVLARCHKPTLHHRIHKASIEAPFLNGRL
jgi:transcription elongation factor Elf1